MKMNKAIKKPSVETYEGGKASRITALEELTRATMSCLLWEDNFYENGVSIAQRIEDLVKKCLDNGVYDDVIRLLKRVKHDMRIRHCPLWMIVAIYRAGKTVSKDVIADILTRPDDMGELLTLYRSVNPKAPIPNAMKKGIALAFQKFDEYQLAKYSRDANYKLVDVANLCHPKVTEAIDKLVKGTLKTPQTWEVGLSKAGSDKDAKRKVWEELIESKKLGAMAFLKNIRGINDSDVSRDVINEYIKGINASKLLPIDFLRSAWANPAFESQLEEKFLSVFDKDKVKGRTAVLIDVSGSMEGPGLKYAQSLAMIAREMYEDVDIYSFSNEVVLIPNRHGFALAEAIDSSQSHCGTYMWGAIRQVCNGDKYERLIVVTDEQAHDSPSANTLKHSYIINIAPYKKGVGYAQGFKHINGFSDKVFDYINEIENM